MKTEWIKLEGNLGEIKVEFEAQEWKAAQDKALKKLAKRVNIPGFRAGKAPMAMVKKQLSPVAILQDAMDAILDEHFTKIIMDCPEQVIAQPTLDINEINEGALKVTFKVEVKPEITLGQYKGFEVTKEAVEVTEEEIENELKHMQEQYAELTVKEEGTVEEGDTAVIDFEGFVDGVAFEGGKGENHPLVIGSHSFIEGFEEQLVGMAANEEKEIQVKFPENYGAEDLSGKDATFKVLVHEIKTRTLPALEELAEEAEIEGVETLEDLKLNIKTRMLNQKEAAAEEKYTDELYTKVIEATEFDLPEAILNQELESTVNDIRQNIQNQGLDLDTFLKITGKTAETFKEEIKPQAEKRARLNLILEAIVKAENLTVSEEEIDEEIKAMAESYGKEFDEVKELLAAYRNTISGDLLMRKAVAIIRDGSK